MWVTLGRSSPRSGDFNPKFLLGRPVRNEGWSWVDVLEIEARGWTCQPCSHCHKIDVDGDTFVNSRDGG
jgi:hypothetical protein